MLTVATSDLLSGPTRILFPKAPGASGMSEAADFPFSLLGLGDIAIPGLLACLALRFDATQLAERKRAEEEAAAAARRASGAAAARNGLFGADGPLSFLFSLGGRQQQQDKEAAASVSRSAGGEGEPQPFEPTEDVLQNRNYFKPVMVAYVGGLLMAFAANSITHLGQPALLYLVPVTTLTVLGVSLSRGELGTVWGFNDVASFGALESLREQERQEQEQKKLKAEQPEVAVRSRR